MLFLVRFYELVLPPNDAASRAFGNLSPPAISPPSPKVSTKSWELHPIPGPLFGTMVVWQWIFERNFEMMRDQVISKLTELGVHPNSYSLDGMRNGDRVCVVEDSGKWKVFYVERDKPDELAALDTIEAAYDFVYATFRKWLGKRLQWSDVMSAWPRPGTWRVTKRARRKPAGTRPRRTHGVRAAARQCDAEI